MHNEQQLESFAEASHFKILCTKIKPFSENKICEATFVTTLKLINVLNDVRDRHFWFHCDFFHSFSLRSCW